VASSPSNSSTEIRASFVLLGAAVVALILANSALSDLYGEVLATPIRIGVGAYELADPLKDWIKNALMAVFFLFIGLEIKAEFKEGTLSDASRAALPFAAAVGGMAAPALVYLALAGGDPVFANGWAIPAATDIAFAVGVVGLLGKRVPTALKAFLLAVAVIDDLGAILVIAAFYTAEISLVALAWAAGAVLALAVFNAAGVTRLAPYLLVGAVLWFCVLKSGVNPTLAGVVTALFVPLHGTGARAHPLHDLVHALKFPVLFVIMPVFALANAGVPLVGLGFDEIAHPVTAGIALGLALGKPMGILLCVFVVVRAGLAHLPAGASWAQVAGIACIAGIGFTMSLFIGALAFTDGSLMNQVRLGVLAGSTVSALAGVAILLFATRAAALGAPARPVSALPGA
jgi:NhaA family Na+:H+ antiporter